MWFKTFPSSLGLPPPPHLHARFMFCDRLKCSSEASAADSLRKMCSVHEWVHILVLLLVNPVSMMSLTPALLLLAACFLAYSVALVVVICHVRHILIALDFIVKWGLPYFMRDPIRASVYFGSLLLVLPFSALLTLWPKVNAAAAALLLRCATALRSSSPLATPYATLH